MATLFSRLPLSLHKLDVSNLGSRSRIAKGFSLRYCLENSARVVRRNLTVSINATLHLKNNDIFNLVYLNQCFSQSRSRNTRRLQAESRPRGRPSETANSGFAVLPGV